MTRYLSLSILQVGNSRFLLGLVLFNLCAVLLPSGEATGSSISPYCTTFDNAGGTIPLHEGQWNNFTIYTWSIECEAAACISANTSCTLACASCATFNNTAYLKIDGEGFNGTAVSGLNCSIGNSTTPGQYPASCLAMNNLAGRSGYTLVLTVMDNGNAVLGNKSANISFVAGDVVIPKCVGSIENGTNKVYLGYDNVLQIFLMDEYNNSVGAKTGRTGITPIPFNVTVTWNPDDGSKVTLGQPPTVDTTKGDDGYYTALLNPTKTGNYLAKIGSNDTMIMNSPIPFQAIKGDVNR
ncbi:hypothetical protein R1sor_016324 [Riccia sorocarpa]|uniref:GEX2 N-terminal Ig-like domain-containing protein n=1 Tax=Riccia sorocarpa TaxID=122646 RepID=A0ABD3HEN4_9MARC